MRFFSTLPRIIVVTGLVALLFACSSTPTYNASVFPYEIDKQRLAEDKMTTLVIAHVNLGAPSRNYLEKEAPRVDAMVSSYLKQNGYKVVPQREFEQHWNEAVRAYGDPVDPTTGKVNMKSFAQIMTSVRDEMQETTDLDGFVFTDLVEVQTAFSAGLQHVARWHGVSRKPSLQGPGDGVTTDFDWAMLVAAASLQVSIYDMDLKRVFLSYGGLDVTEAIDTRSSTGRYVRRRETLGNPDNIQEGIELAFYPFVPYENWPGKP